MNDFHDTDGKPEEIVAQSRVTLDGDLSSERVAYLLTLEEEERLEFKVVPDPLDNRTQQKQKVEFVCDTVAIANTDGGYILLGVEDHTKKPVGVPPTAQDILRSDVLQTWVASFVDGTLRLTVAPRELPQAPGATLIAVYVQPSRVPVPFSKDGQYTDQKGDQVHKFAEGQVFVRHGSKSELANHADMIRLEERIRADERRKVLPLSGVASKLFDRLDAIIALLGGLPSGSEAFGLLEGVPEEVRRRAASYLDPTGKARPKRLIQDELRELLERIKATGEIREDQELLSAAHRVLEPFLFNLFSLWESALDTKRDDFAEELANQTHRLYIKLHEVAPTRETIQIDALWFQAQLMDDVYTMGALAVAQDKPRFARLLIEEKATPFDPRFARLSWFRYVLAMLSRTQRLKTRSLCSQAIDFAKEGKLVPSFDSEEALIDAVCQFDFLQCFCAFMRRDSRMWCWPSFAAYVKRRTEPVVENIIENCGEDAWTPRLAASKCAQILRSLNEYAKHEFGLEGPWDLEWNSPKIKEFLAQNLQQT